MRIAHDKTACHDPDTHLCVCGCAKLPVMPTSTLAVAALKGGVGKTTTAMAMAAAAVSMGARTTVVDLDPQGSAHHWATMSLAAGYAPPFQVITVRPSELYRRLPVLDCDLAIIDTPPVIVDIVRAALAHAHRVIIPVQPRIGDVSRVPVTASLVRETPAVVMAALTMVRPGTAAVEEARAALAQMGVPVAAATLPLRESVARSYGYGMSSDLLFFGRALLTQLAEGN
jgi:chromosome partitioning protein